MTVSINTAPISPLRQRMQHDMIMRGLGSHTQKDYIRHVKRLAAFLGRPPDSATEDVLRRFQLMQHSPDLKVADIFRAAGPAYRVAHAGHLSLHQLKVMSAIETCRTAALGHHVEACEDCGHWRIAFNSCRNRHCPKCQGAAARTWLAEREADLLPVGV
ncbi:MAG TPA: hypothetical protein DCG90_14085 [Sphingobium sp.]|nr:hypothetical protein [Sphingobium sp.]